ncbi:MAG: CPBP family intramembrane metalloprotease [Acidobacteria bacterium]|nr:CPBP family intramembrane metalloprotease [Acidobacteriota bacterium]MBS1864713.1 CPBP family intramembrane metalloprotease [Acidobacteriota bacterium]
MDFSSEPPPASEPASPQLQSGANSPNPLFYNEEGIRPGWRILLYLALGFFLYGILLVPVSLIFRAPPGPYSVSTIMLGEAMMFAAAFGAAIIMSKIEQQPVGLYGLALASAFGKRFWQGMFVGLCEISLLIGAMALLGAYSFGNLAFHGGKILQWGALWLVASILIALPEEFLFRGYTQHTLAEGIGFWPAAIILSVLFGLMHKLNPGENWIGVMNIVFTGLLWAFSLRRTGTLWFAVGWHAAFDFGESFLFSVPNSGGVFEGHLSNATFAPGRAWLTGGDVGPEASVFAFLTLILGAIVVHFWFPAKGQPIEVKA